MRRVALEISKTNVNGTEYLDMNMDIKDLTGLSQPLKQLVKNVSRGVGKCTESYFSRKKTDATVYQIEKISEAMRKSPLKIEYKSENIKLISEQNNIQQEDVENILELHERAIERALTQDANRQSNIEKIVSNAAEELKDEAEIPEEDLDQDWLNRFFRTAEDISTEKMQHLWGKILSGELKKPGSFSLRALELLKSISQKEAETFSKVANCSITCNNTTFLLRDYSYLETEYDISADDIITLQEIGILHSSDQLSFNLFAGAAGEPIFFFIGDDVAVLERVSDHKDTPIPGVIFTRVGSELLHLIEMNDKETYLSVAKMLKTFIEKKIEVDHLLFGPYQLIEGNKIKYSKKQFREIV